MKPEKQEKISPAGKKTVIEFADGDDVFSPDRLYSVPCELIEPSPFDSQAERRKRFTTEKLLELGESIALNGLIEPITIREKITGGRRYFEIVCGERRWRASALKNLKTVSCFIKDLDDSQVLILQYEENHQQQPNAPLDDALCFKLLHEKEGLSEQEIADRTGTTLKNVVLKLRLNDLIDEIKLELEAGKLPLKHAYLIATLSVGSQKEVFQQKYAYKYYDREEKPVNFKEFEKELDANVFRPLRTAPFNIGDPRLHIKQLICVECPEQTNFQKFLFPEYNGDARCLNSACYRLKTDTHLRLKREEIATAKPNPTHAPIEEVAKSIPLVTEKSYAPAATPFIREKVITNAAVLPEPECEFSEPSLAVGGERKGEEVFICRNESCEIHHPKSEPEKDWQTERRAAETERKIKAAVRDKVLGEAAKTFDDYNPVWKFDDLIQKLLLHLWYAMAWDTRQAVLEIVKDWRKLPDSSFKAQVVEYLAALDKRQQSQLIFLFIHSEYFYSNDNGDEVRRLCLAYTKLDYDRVTEEIRETLVG